MSPRLQALKEDFEKSGGSFEEFRIGDFFTLVKRAKVLNKRDILSAGKYFVYSSNTLNNGVIGYTNQPDYHIKDKNKPFLLFGDHTRSFYIARDDFSTADNVKVLECPDRISDEALLYIITCWQKAIPSFGYSRHWKYAAKSMPVLPVTTEKELAFSYMEQYIREVEAELVCEAEDESAREAEAYLLASGFNDCELTEEERAALEHKPSFEEFRIGELFEKLDARFIGKGNKFKQVSTKPDKDYSIPLVYAKYGDNGIMYWGKPSDFQYYKNAISIIYNGAIAAGLCYAQEENTSILAESYLIDFKENRDEIPFEAKLYISAVINKSIYPKYSRDHLATWNNRVENDFITLPVDSNNSLDFAYMQAYISAIKKLVIADVVKWKDCELAALHRVIQD